MYHTIEAYHDSTRISEILVVQNHNYTLSEFSCTAHAQMEIMETQLHFPLKYHTVRRNFACILCMLCATYVQLTM